MSTPGERWLPALVKAKASRWDGTRRDDLRYGRGGFPRRHAMHWRSAPETTDAMLGTGHDHALYAVGWTISGVATLATIVAVWMFGI
jgi:hypothetical protein